MLDYEIEEKTSGGAVYEAGVRESKRNKALRRIAQPLMDKYWKNRGQNVRQRFRPTVQGSLMPSPPAGSLFEPHSVEGLATSVLTSFPWTPLLFYVDVWTLTRTGRRPGRGCRS